MKLPIKKLFLIPLISLVVGTPFCKATIPSNDGSGYNEAKIIKVTTEITVISVIDETASATACETASATACETASATACEAASATALGGATRTILEIIPIIAVISAIPPIIKYVNQETESKKQETESKKQETESEKQETESEYSCRIS